MSTGIADTAYFGPEAEFYVFSDVRFEQDTHSAFYPVDSIEGAWNSGKDEKPNLGFKPRYKEGYFPGPADGPFPGPPLRDGPRDGGARHRDRGPAPRGGHRRPGRDRHALRHAARHGRQAHALQVRGEERGPGPRPDGDVHAQAHLPGQRVRDARPLLAVEGRRAALLLGAGLRRALRPRPLVHRRPAQARSGHPGLRGADDQQLQAPGARLRGPGQPGLQPAQPLGRLPHPASTRRARRPSGSSSAARTRPATRIWPSRPS